MAAALIHHRTCCLCEALCGLRIEHDGHRVLSIRGDDDDPLSRGHICPKATALKELHEDPDRLRKPVRRGEGWEELGFTAALDLAADRIAAIQKEHGPDSVAMYLGNPVAHNYRALLGAQVLGDVLHSKNRFSASTVDQVPHMFAAWTMFGHPLLMPVPDLERCKRLVVLGANPAVSNGSIMTAPDMKRRLKEIRQRGTVVVIDPRRTETAELADAWHAIRPGSDALFLLAFLNVLFDEDLVDDSAWRSWSRNLDALARVAGSYPPSRVAEAVGIPAETIRALARDHAAADGAVLYGRLGVATQRFGGLSSWLVYAVNVVTGNLDRPGGLMFTHPAVDLVKLTKLVGPSGGYGRWHTVKSRLPEFNAELPASALAEQIREPGRSQIKALIVVGGNPVLSTPDGRGLGEAIDGLDFVLCVDPWISATGAHADLVIPPTSHLESDHFGIAFHAFAVRNTVKYSEPLFPPPDGALDDWQILTGLAKRLAARSGHRKARVDRVRTAAARALGARGLLDLALRTGRHGLRKPLGHRLSVGKLAARPSGLDLGSLEPCLPGRLANVDGRVDLAPQPLVGDVKRLERALTDGDFSGDRLVLIGRRQLRGCNSWLHNAPGMMAGRQRRCTVLMHPDDAASRELRDGQPVTLESRVGAVTAPLELDDGMMPGVVSLPHGWGHSQTDAVLSVAQKHRGVSINDLTDPEHIDRLTGNAGLTGVPVTVR